jgi:hypothetical protein
MYTESTGSQLLRPRLFAASATAHSPSPATRCIVSDDLGGSSFVRSGVAQLGTFQIGRPRLAIREFTQTDGFRGFALPIARLPRVDAHASTLPRKATVLWISAVACF